MHYYYYYKMDAVVFPSLLPIPIGKPVDSWSYQFTPQSEVTARYCITPVYIHASS